MRNKYRWAVIIFMVFFGYEYLTPIVNALNYGTSIGLDWSTILSQKQVIKHVLRLPIYGMAYIWIFIKISKGWKPALGGWRTLALLHVFTKIFSTILFIKYADKMEFIAINNSKEMVLGYLVVILGVYLLTFGIVEKYWKTEFGDKKRS